jgi:hypothetical protein
MASLDPDASIFCKVAPLSVAPAAPAVGPKIFQLSPLPGNIYKSDCFFYDSAADVSQSAFGQCLLFLLLTATL